MLHVAVALLGRCADLRSEEELGPKNTDFLFTFEITVLFFLGRFTV